MEVANLKKRQEVFGDLVDYVVFDKHYFSSAAFFASPKTFISMSSGLQERFRGRSLLLQSTSPWGRHNFF